LYSNTISTNIIAKVAFAKSVQDNVVQFYPYTIENNMRADEIAKNYYGDSSYDWVVYLSNNIIDPVNEWYKTQEQLDALIEQKYGSFVDALARVKYYTVNYQDDERVITTAAYTALTSGQKKYWSPRLNSGNVVVGYQRAALDWNIESFNSVELAGTFQGLNTGDLIKQSSSINGEVSYANTSLVVIKNVSGTWVSGNAVYHGTTGEAANATITSVSSVTSALPADEVAYWTSVSAYDYENNVNESRREIALVGVSFVNQIERDMRDALS
jgi:Base plate wedge protein 53